MFLPPLIVNWGNDKIIWHFPFLNYDSMKCWQQNQGFFFFHFRCFSKTQLLQHDMFGILCSTYYGTPSKKNLMNCSKKTPNFFLFHCFCCNIYFSNHSLHFPFLNRLYHFLQSSCSSMIFLVLSTTLQQQNKAQSSKGTQLVPKGCWLGTQPQWSEIRGGVIYSAVHHRKHTLHVPKPERPLSTPAKAPAIEVAKSRTRKEKRNRTHWTWDQWGNQVSCYSYCASIPEASSDIWAEITVSQQKCHLTRHSPGI